MQAPLINYEDLRMGSDMRAERELENRGVVAVGDRGRLSRRGRGVLPYRFAEP